MRDGDADCIARGRLRLDRQRCICVNPMCGPTCTDMIQNRDETDVDCGNACGPTCEDGEMCDDDADCISDICDEAGLICIGPECDDGEQNGDETDVDCGGSCGPTCEDGEMCDDGDDCISMVCDDGSGTCTSTTSWCVDADDDGFGDPDDCTDVDPGDDPPDGTVPNDDDCDDTSEFTFPGAAPNDSATECMEDKDGDDWGDLNPGGGNTTPGTDCDDDSPAAADTFPGAAPNDSATECMEDKDGDDWGDDDPGGGDTTAGTDCDDDSAAAAATFPGAAPNDSATECMEDKDDDDWGDDDPGDGDTTPGTDCDDDSAAAVDTFPGAAPNDDPTACMEDKDDDDWGDDDPSSGDSVPGTDCDDDSATAGNTFPGAAEHEDPADACMKDEDDDGWGDDTPPGGAGGGITPGSDCDEDGEPPCVLLSTQDGTLNDTYDQGLNTVLVGLGYDVTPIEESEADAEDANGYTLVVISETSFSGDIGGTFRDVFVPVICLEGLVWDNMSMAPEADNTGTDDVDILAIGDPRAGGLAATHTVIGGVGAGLFYTSPNANADNIASITGQPTQITYFTFDEGVVMEDMFAAPRRRVGLGYDADQTGPPSVTISTDGQTLFEAAVIWATQ